MTARASAGRGAARPRRYWGLVAPLYESLVRVVLPGHAEMIRRLADDAGDGRRVLDLGSGPGTISAALAKRARHVCAVDREMAMHEQARLRHPSESVSRSLHDAVRLGFAAASFDVVVAANILHLIPEFGAAMAEIRRVLRPGGLALLPTPCHGQSQASRVASRLMRLSGFRLSHRFDQASLCRAIADNGFAVTDVVVLPGVLPIAYVRARAARDV